jgi:hypothetical protein
MIERSGSIPLTNGSGRSKNMWIRWIRIRNTGCYEKQPRKARGVDIIPALQNLEKEMDNNVHEIPRIISMGCTLQINRKQIDMLHIN